MIKEEFVQERKMNKPVNETTLDNTLMVARLLGQVKGLNELNMDTWKEAKLLEERRIQSNQEIKGN